MVQLLLLNQIGLISLSQAVQALNLRGPCYFVFVQPNVCSAEVERGNNVETTWKQRGNNVEKQRLYAVSQVLIASGEADFTTAQHLGEIG